MIRKVLTRLVSILIILLLGLLAMGCSQPPDTAQLSKYEILDQAPYNNLANYPTLSEVPPHYQPVAAWVGRLILPNANEVETHSPQDWVWMEVLHAPAAQKSLIGQTVQLTWQSSTQIDRFLTLVTRDIHFSPEAQAHQRQGNVHPDRLNGWSHVGPLQSLAGARPKDDMIVSLVGVQSVGDNTLTIDQEPTQIPERFYGLIQIETPKAETPSNRSACQGRCQPFQVRHYNATSGQFDGAQDIIYIPNIPELGGIRYFTTEQLEQSPAGEKGWYVYGRPNQQGQFIVQALMPRALMALSPEETITDPDMALNHIHYGNWRHTPKHKGTLSTTQLRSPQPWVDWQLGDQALVLHLFGGIGGENGEAPPVIGTVTGHFAYGIATVVRDPFSQDLRFDIDYQQVYSHNPNGIVAGKINWSEYLGNLQRGWVGSRPISDVIIRFDALTQTYPLPETSLRPLDELQTQLQIMTARYRTGDGTGASIVTPAQSCIQDSSQAVYNTLKSIKTQVQSSPNWQQSIQSNPQTAQHFQQLITLGQELEKELAPIGVVRPDWQQNVNTLAGITPHRNSTVNPQDLANQNNLLTQLLSWRTVIPRVAYDQLATLFFKQGASLQFLRTNQIGGWDATIAPLAPTELFGQSTIVPIAFSRLIEALHWPGLGQWLWTAGVSLGYGLIAIPLGLWQGFLQVAPVFGKVRWPKLIKAIIIALFVPALSEEILFRVLLLPHPSESVLSSTFILWSSLSLVLFVLSHPLQGLIFRPRLFTIFSQPIFIGLTAILGLSCILIYHQTGSLWTITAFHWSVVMAWLLMLGGWQKLRFRP